MAGTEQAVGIVDFLDPFGESEKTSALILLQLLVAHPKVWHEPRLKTAGIQSRSNSTPRNGRWEDAATAANNNAADDDDVDERDAAPLKVGRWRLE